MPQNTQLGKLRVSDPVLTTIVHGYSQSESVAPFIAPVVPVTARSGKIVKFGKEQFSVITTRRAPGSTIQRIGVAYSSENYTINQHAAAGEVSEEEYEEAVNSAAQIDLRTAAAIRASEAVMQSWEGEVIATIANPANYETSCTLALTGTDKISNPASDPEALVSDGKEAVRAQIGVYPNSAIISPKVFNKLKQHPIFRDRIKYTSEGSVNLDLLANWFDLPRGIKVAKRVYLDPTTELLRDFIGDVILLFYSPEAEAIGSGFLPQRGADKARPSFAYTYALNGYPIATPERYDPDRRVFVTDVIMEQSLNLVGLGETGKCGSGFLFTNVL